jgi:inner membrane protein
MDNLTHSLVGALLGQMGLKRKTGLAMPTLIVAANIPDIDAGCTIYGMQSLAMRRGLTHGPIALVLLPLLWQAGRGKRPDSRAPVRFGWLLVLAYVGCLSHPALDWLNNYGIRLLEPFSHRWFYGDTLFIVDVWIWAALVISVMLSLRWERRGQTDWRRPAWAGFAAMGAYIFANGLITGHAESQAAAMLASARGRAPELVVANVQPLTFWRRQMLWRDGAEFGSGDYTLGHGTSLGLARRNLYPSMELGPLMTDNPDLRAFMFWSRMPVVDRTPHGLHFWDQRFDSRLTAGNFTLTVPDKP